MWKTGLLLVLAAACATPPAAAGGGTLADERTYSSDSYVLSVSLPRDWDINEGIALGPGIERLVEAGNEQASIAITVRDLFPVLHSDDRRRWGSRQSVDRGLVGNEQVTMQDLADEWKAAGIEPTWETAALAGWPAGRLTAVQAAEGGAQQRQEVYIAVHNGVLFVVTTWLSGKQPADGETLAAVLGSLQIVRQYTPAPPAAWQKALPLAVGVLFVCLVCLVPWIAFLAAGRRRALRRRIAAGSAGAPAARVAPKVLVDGTSSDLATGGQRLLTYVVDQVVLAPLFFGLSWLFGIVVAIAAAVLAVDAPGEQVLQLAGTLAALAALVTYYGCGEGLWGRTVGKLVAGTRAVRADNSPLGFALACKRALCRLIPLDALSFISRHAPIGWHDWLTGSVVISVQSRKHTAQAQPAGRDAAGDSAATSSST